jgi:hypothetical protein
MCNRSLNSRSSGLLPRDYKQFIVAFRDNAEFSITSSLRVLGTKAGEFEDARRQHFGRCRLQNKPLEGAARILTHLSAILGDQGHHA